MTYLKFGILYKDSKVVNHRSFLKYCLNPVFQIFGFILATNISNNIVGMPTFKLSPRHASVRNFLKQYNPTNHNSYDTLVKKRRFI